MCRWTPRCALRWRLRGCLPMTPPTSECRLLAGLLARLQASWGGPKGRPLQQGPRPNPASLYNRCTTQPGNWGLLCSPAARARCGRTLRRPWLPSWPANLTPSPLPCPPNSREHSVENQLPFLKRCMSGRRACTIAPVCVGWLGSVPAVDQAAQQLLRALRSAPALLVATSDFTHAVGEAVVGLCAVCWPTVGGASCVAGGPALVLPAVPLPARQVH